MAVQQANYGSQTAFTASSNLSSMASNVVRGMGSVAASGFASNPLGYKINAVIKAASTGVTSTGFISFYLVESNDGGTTWTDGANVTTSASITNARLVYQAIATANSQVVTVNFDLPCYIPPQTWSLMVSNGTGASFSSTGYQVEYLPYYQTVS